MAVESRWRLLLPKQVRELPADLAAIVLLVVLTNLSVLLPVVSETPLRVVFGLAFVLFIPGYAFIAALFPEAGGGPAGTDDPPVDSSGEESGAAAGRATDGGTLEDRGIDGIERTALSFGLSIAIVPLVGLVLNFTPFGIRLVPILVSISLLTLVFVAVGATRRWQLPREERFQVPYRAWVTAGKQELLAPPSRTDAALNVVLVLSILLALGSVGFAVAVPQQGEQFTEFYLLTENETGDLVADGYPTEFERGESRELIVGIGNQEHERTNYTVIVELQRVDIVGNETRVRETSELRRFQPTVAHNATWHRQHTVTPQMTGDRLRLQYLLYKGSPSTPLNRSQAYRELHLWVNVTAR